MKISLRILLINFIVVALIFISSTVAYYTLTKKLIVLQNSKVVLNSVNDFSISIRSILQDTENDFFLLLKNGELPNTANIDKNSLDFIFRINPDSSINPDLFFFKPSINHSDLNSLSDFLKNNPCIFIQVFKSKNGVTYFFGRSFSGELLDKLAKRIRADIAFVSEDIPIEFSDSVKNSGYVLSLIKANKNTTLKVDKSKDIFIDELDNSDFYAASFKLDDYGYYNKNKSFLVFTTVPEAAELRHNINQLVLIIGITGVALSLILVLLFTDKIRKQITQLSKAADIIKSGNIKHRVNILSNDELGQLGTAFNSMLDEIEKKEVAESEYSEFISLINQNPSLLEVADIALNKIVILTNAVVGQLYLISNNTLELLTSYGIKRELVLSKEKVDLFKQVIERGETVEFNFKANESPRISTGLIELELKYILIFPIIYNKKVIAVLELGIMNTPEREIKDYLRNIHDQLAIGLTNASAFRQLEDLVKELKELNEEYHKKNEQVTEQNIKLTELHNQIKEKADELEIQKEKAIESTILKSQFLATVSHELRTPLSSILGLTELVLGDNSITHQNKDKLKVVLRNGNRLMNLINDILEFTKIEAGKMELNREEFYLKDLINDIDIQISSLIRDKKINFVINNELKSELQINSDRDKITHVLINLLSNAVKFTEEGMVIFKTKLVEENKLQFDIIDSGIGISEKDLKVIFEEFRQADNTNTRKYGGAGLGLAISKRYAESLNGKISARSEIGKGSNFTFILPVDILNMSELNDPNQLSLDLHEDESAKQILVIDSNYENQNIVGQYLTSKKYNLVYSSNYEEAFRKAHEQNPFAITLNTLSIEKGWELLKILKGNPKTRHIPASIVLFLDELNLGYGLEVLEYFVKPIEISHLLSCIFRIEKVTNSKLKNLLLVDGDTGFYKNLYNEFLKENIELGLVEDGTTAFKAALVKQPDLIIIDITMKGLDGISIVHQLKESVETKDIPIIFTIPDSLSEKSIAQLNHNFEKAALKSKWQKNDVLKIIRDRINFEEGNPIEDNNAIWMDSKPDTITQSEPRSKSKKINKPKVLIVDDDTDTLFTVGEIVRQAGCDIVFAKNGLECLSSLQMFIPDLVLLDIMMPRMDGFETIKRIRADNTMNNMPVYAMTAQAMLDDKDIIIRNGFTDFISKPVNASSLISKIEKTINISVDL